MSPTEENDIRAAVQASIAAAIEKSDCDMIDYVAASIDAHAADTRPMAKALAEALAPVLERVARLENPVSEEGLARAHAVATKPAATDAKPALDSSGKSGRCKSILQGVDGIIPSLLCSLTSGHEGDHRKGDTAWNNIPAPKPSPQAPEREPSSHSNRQAPERIHINGPGASSYPHLVETEGFATGVRATYVRVDLLEAAERRIAELEAVDAINASSAVTVGLYIDKARAEGRAESAARIAEMEKRVQIAGEDMGIVAEQHLEVGREAGIREAADALVHQFCKDGDPRPSRQEAGGGDVSRAPVVLRFAMAKPLLRLARCRHPEASVWSINLPTPQEVCLNCGSRRTSRPACTWSPWVRPKLVADLIAEARARVTPTPCATCGGARFVCDEFSSPGPCRNALHRNRRPCPECSKKRIQQILRQSAKGAQELHETLERSHLEGYSRAMALVLR